MLKPIVASTMPAVLSKEETIEKLTSIPIGSKITIKYHHVRDTDTIRSVTGVLLKRGDVWMIKRSSTSYNIIPSDYIVVREVIVIDSTSRSASVRRDEEMNYDEADSAAPFGEQRRPQQPPAEDNNFMERMMKNQETMLEVMKSVMESRSLPQAATPTTSQHQVAPGSDVATLLRMSDALRGQDNPTWRLAPGLLLPRFLPERFQIFSMPHLLFQEDPSTGEMVKVPKGTALMKYRSMLPSCKLQFPNQVTIKMPRNDKQKHDTIASALTPDAAAGVRAEIERAERMFADLLSRLDLLDAKDLPTTKNEWMIFIDAGVNILDFYSTMANGFIKGGSKLSQSYAATIFSTGKFDPVKLWQSESDSFPKQH